MFEGLVTDAENTALLNLFKLVDDELDGVELRLRAKSASADSMAMMIAYQQLDVLEVWRPAIKSVIKKLGDANEKSAAR